MREFIGIIMVIIIIFGSVCSCVHSNEHLKLTNIKREYCKKHQYDNLDERLLCEDDLVTFYKRKVLKGATK